MHFGEGLLFSGDETRTKEKSLGLDGKQRLPDALPFV
jgi:hypothetical protein